jgi:DNA processing protein
VYPARNSDLWQAVGERGLLLTESPRGRRPMTYTFPERNRIIAQLSRVLVVVESSRKGGSLITVDRALERGRLVMAVPGSPLLESTGGSNELLRGGRLGRLALPCLGSEDVLSVLELAEVASDDYLDQRAEPSELGSAILASIGWDSWTVSKIVVRTGLTIGQISSGLSHLERDGWVAFESGAWHRVAVAPGLPSTDTAGRQPKVEEK